MLKAVRLPISSKPVSDSEIIRATVTDVRQWVTDAQENALQYALRIGKALIELRALCQRNSEKFGSYFPKNDSERDDPRKLPFVYRTGNMLMQIAGNEAIENVKHVSHSAPSDWGSLYQLSRIPAPKLSKLIEHKQVNSNMTRAEASNLAKEHAAPRSSPKAKQKKRSAAPVDRPDMKPVAAKLWSKHTVGEIEELIEMLRAEIDSRMESAA